MKFKKLSIVTFNVKGVPSVSKFTQSRLIEVAKKLNHLDADIINLQEVFTYDNFHILKNGLLNFPYYTYEPFILGPKGGIVTFSRLKLEKKRYVSFSPLVLLRFGQVQSLRRNILSGKGILLSQLAGSEIYIINTHLLVNAHNEWSRHDPFFQIQLNQVKQLRKVIFDIKKFALIISTGDFNIPKHTILYKQMIQDFASKDTFQDDSFTTFCGQ